MALPLTYWPSFTPWRVFYSSTEQRWWRCRPSVDGVDLGFRGDDEDEWSTRVVDKPRIKPSGMIVRDREDLARARRGQRCAEGSRLVASAAAREQEGGDRRAHRARTSRGTRSAPVAAPRVLNAVTRAVLQAAAPLADDELLYRALLSRTTRNPPWSLQSAVAFTSLIGELCAPTPARIEQVKQIVDASPRVSSDESTYQAHVVGQELGRVLQAWASR